MNNHNFQKLLELYTEKLNEFNAYKQSRNFTAHKMHILNRELLQLRKRVDTYGSTPRLNLKDIYLIQGYFRQFLYSVEQVNYYSPPKSFQIYLTGIYEDDLKILLPFKLNGSVDPDYQIVKLEFGKPKY